MQKTTDETIQKILAGDDTKALVRYLRESPTSMVMAAAADKIEKLEAQLEAVGAGGVDGRKLMGKNEGEPVAWRYKTPTGWHATTDAARALGVAKHHSVEPLYAAPQPDGQAIRNAALDEAAAYGR